MQFPLDCTTTSRSNSVAIFPSGAPTRIFHCRRLTHVISHGDHRSVNRMARLAVRTRRSEPVAGRPFRTSGNSRRSAPVARDVRTVRLFGRPSWPVATGGELEGPGLAEYRDPHPADAFRIVVPQSALTCDARSDDTQPRPPRTAGCRRGGYRPMPISRTSGGPGGRGRWQQAPMPAVEPIQVRSA